MDLNILINFFVALLSILNPLGNIPIFISVTDDEQPGVRRDMAVLLAVFIFISLLIFFFAGGKILKFFGISMPAFRIAGGILILLMAIGMMHGGKRETEHLQTEPAQGSAFKIAESKLSKIIVPVGIPLFVGPGSISTVILYSQKAHNAAALAAMAAVLLLAALVMMLLLMTSNRLQAILGHNGLQIGVRIMGLMLAAIAVQFILDGLAGSTVGIFNLHAIHAVQ